METRFVDLSMEIYQGMPNFTNDSKCAVIVHNSIDSVGYNITQIVISTHQGTHIDAPYHFLKDGITVDRLPLNSFIGEAFKIDMTHKKPGEPIDVEDFLPFKDKIVKGSKVIYCTGWDKVFPDKCYFTDFPYMTKELGYWLASREISLLGMDTPAPSPTDFFNIHHVLFKKNVVIVEGLANLDKLMSEKFFLFAAPLKIKDRDGSPVRAVAVEGYDF